MVKARHSRFPPWKSSSSTLILTVLIMFTLVIFILLTLGVLSMPSHPGDLPKANDLNAIQQNMKVVENDEKGEQWVEVISSEPRAFIYHNFLTEEECKYLIDLAKPHMQKSTVVDSETGKSKDSRVRTSSGTFLARGRDKIIRDIEKRISDFTFLPVASTLFIRGI